MIEDFCIAEALRIQNEASLLLDAHVYPTSWLSHVPFAKDLIGHMCPNLVVELGTYYGVSLRAFAESIAQNDLDTILIGIDNFVGDIHVGEFDESIYGIAQKQILPFSNQCSLKKSDFTAALNDFEDESIDILHIDGTHTYESVKNDFNLWKNKISPYGVVIFHDIHVRRSNFGVHKLWSEIKMEYTKHFEFDFGYGLGVLFVHETDCDWLENLIEASKTNYWKIISSAYNERASAQFDELIRQNFKLENELIELKKDFFDLLSKLESLESKKLSVRLKSLRNTLNR